MHIRLPFTENKQNFQYRKLGDIIIEQNSKKTEKDLDGLSKILWFKKTLKFFTVYGELDLTCYVGRYKI